MEFVHAVGSSGCAALYVMASLAIPFHEAISLWFTILPPSTCGTNPYDSTRKNRTMPAYIRIFFVSSLFILSSCFYIHLSVKTCLFPDMSRFLALPSVKMPPFPDIFAFWALPSVKTPPFPDRFTSFGRVGRAKVGSVLRAGKLVKQFHHPVRQVPPGEL